MLDEKPHNIKAVVHILRSFGIYGRVDHNNHGIKLSKESPHSIDIPYGFNGKQNGSIRISNNNYELTHVTRNGAFIKINEYNHQGDFHQKSSFIDCLRDTDLMNPLTGRMHRSGIIFLTSEGARSNMVMHTVLRFFASHSPGMSMDVWLALEDAVKEYDKTRRYRTANPMPGTKPGLMEPLDGMDYLRYKQSLVEKNDGQTDRKKTEIARIKKLLAYQVTGH